MLVPTLWPRCGGSTASSSACRMRSGQASTFTLQAASTALMSHPWSRETQGSLPGCCQNPHNNPDLPHQVPFRAIPAPRWLRAAELPQGDAHPAHPSTQITLNPCHRLLRLQKHPQTRWVLAKAPTNTGGRTCCQCVCCNAARTQKEKRMLACGLCSIVILISEVMQTKSYF